MSFEVVFLRVQSAEYLLENVVEIQHRSLYKDNTKTFINIYCIFISCNQPSA